MTNIVALSETQESVWQLVLDRVRAECNDYFGLTILDTVGYDGFADGVVTLTAPDELRENWVNTHYGELLRKGFESVLGDAFVNYKIRIVEPTTKIYTPTLATAPVKPAAPKKKRPAKVKLSLYAGYTFENFVEGSSNFTACNACKSVAENPGDPALNPLFVYGKSGLGKTHLLQSIAACIHNANPYTRVVYCHAYDFLQDATAVSKALKLKTGNVKDLSTRFQEKYENCEILLLDDVQLLEHGPATQERLAILIKHLRSLGKQVVLSCDRHPSKFNKLMPGEKREKSFGAVPSISEKLLAPLESCVAVGIDEPDLNTRMKLIQKKSCNIPFVDSEREEICRFLSIPHRENIRIIEGVLNGLSAMNEFCEERLDLGAVKRLVAPSKTKSEITPLGIAEVVALEFNTEILALKSKRQDAGVAMPRKIAMYLSRELTKISLEKIGEIFNRDYSSVIAAIQSLKKQMDNDETLTRRVQDIRYLLEA